MASFLYFVPGVEKSGIKSVRELPQDLLLVDVLHDVRGTGDGPMGNLFDGPGGKRGLMFSVPPGDRRAGSAAVADYQPDQQTWFEVKHKATGDSAYWIGYYNDAKPTPVDLTRPHQFRGHDIKLGDGNDWHVAVLKPASFETVQNEQERRALQSLAAISRPFSTIPESFTMDGMGAVELGITPEYRAVCAESEKWFELAALGEAGEFNKVDLWKFAVACLSVNYRIGQFEASGHLLNLLDSESMWRVVRTACGGVEIEAEFAERAKKNGLTTTGN